MASRPEEVIAGRSLSPWCGKDVWRPRDEKQGDEAKRFFFFKDKGVRF